MKSTDKVQEEFDQLALKLAEKRDGPKMQGQFNFKKTFLLENLPAHCQNALDIGCGLGGVARLLAQHTKHVLALDLSPEMIRIARERSVNFPNIDFQVADAATWDFPHEQFDYIVSISTLHHLSLEPILTKIKGALKPGGVLLVLDLYRPEGLFHKLRQVIKPTVNKFKQLLTRNKTPQQPKHGRMWEHDPDEVYPLIREVRPIYCDFLPGSRMGEHYARRYYSLVWKKP